MQSRLFARGRSRARTRGLARPLTTVLVAALAALAAPASTASAAPAIGAAGGPDIVGGPCSDPGVIGAQASFLGLYDLEGFSPGCNAGVMTGVGIPEGGTPTVCLPILAGASATGGVCDDPYAVGLPGTKIIIAWSWTPLSGARRTGTCTTTIQYYWNPCVF